jgi:aminopeptidase N
VAVAKGATMKPAYTGSIPSIQSAVAASQQKKAEAAAVKRNKELIALQKKQLSATKAITASKKASAVFDMDQIQIVAALKGKITEEESIRLRLQSAILMGNNSEAARLTVELSKTAGMTKELSTWLANLPTAKNPFEAWQSYLDGIMNTISRIATSTPQAGFSMGGGAGYEVPTNPYAGTYYGETGRDPMPVNIVISTTDQFASALRYDLLDNSLSGKQSAVDRNLGSF